MKLLQETCLKMEMKKKKQLKSQSFNFNETINGSKKLLKSKVNESSKEDKIWVRQDSNCFKGRNEVSFYLDQKLIRKWIRS